MAINGTAHQTRKRRRRDDRAPTSAGFTLVELLIGMAMLAFGLLAVGMMFTLGYQDVASGGRTTIAVAAARQIMEDVHALPYASIANLNPGGVVFNTDFAGTQPTANPSPERTMARKWRYALAGAGSGWGVLPDDPNWTTLTMMDSNVRGSAQVTVADLSATLRQVTVTVTLRGQTAQLVTQISRL